MLEIMTIGEMEKGPVFDPPVAGYNFTTGSTSVKPTILTPNMSTLDIPSSSPIVPALSGYGRVAFRSGTVKLSTMSDISNIGTGDFTFEHWICHNGSNGTSFALRNASGNPVFYVTKSTTNWVIYGLGMASSSFIRIESIQGNNNWGHLAISRKNGRLYAHMNGRRTRLAAPGGQYQDSLPITASVACHATLSEINSPFSDYKWAEFAVSDFAKYEADFEPMHPLY